MMNFEIFREYDIRGIADRDLTPQAVVRLGRAAGTYMLRHGCRTIALGRDVRLSSGRLRDNLVEGLAAAGIDVIDLGECPTPLLYYALFQLDVEGGIMITGSHNPPEYNGFKVAVGKTTLYGDQIQQIRRISEEGSFAAGQGRVATKSFIPDYLNELSQSFGRLADPPRVVVDCGNGTASFVAADLYRNLGCEVVPLFCRADGRFPNHHPDPTVAENLVSLIDEVVQRGADLGIAFDGDSDRIGVIDDKGRIIWGDELMVLFSRQILQKHPGATIIAEVKCSQKLFDDIRKRGGNPIMWKAGHSLIKAKMKEENALLAGEMSGHMFFADRYYGYDDAFYAGARLLELCSDSKQKISEMLADLPQTYSTPEIRMECPESLKFEVVGRAQQYFSSHFKTSAVDGVRLIFDDGWGLVRASNTQPVLVLRFEATSEARLREIRTLVEGKLRELMELTTSGAGEK